MIARAKRIIAKLQSLQDALGVDDEDPYEAQLEELEHSVKEIERTREALRIFEEHLDDTLKAHKAHGKRG